MKNLRVVQVGDHQPEVVRNLSMFDVKRVEPTLEELKLLVISLQVGINKIETAIEFNSLDCLRSSLRDFDDVIKGLPNLRGSIEIVIHSAGRT